MTRFLDQRILLLVISCLTRLQSTKVLSEWKKCGDRECETAMSRVQATTDYLGPDCRYLNFKAGEEIMVYSKLSRKNENLWTGSKGKDFGYFPKDAVKVEEVLIADEVEVLTKEADFLCLHGDQYAFENEDNALKDHNKESEYSSSDVELKLHENELLKYTRDSMEKEERVISVSLNDSTESHTQEESASKEFIRKNENRQDETEEPQMQNSVPLKPVPTQSSWIAGWFTTESKNNEEPLKVTTESLEENTYRGRKLAVTDENYLQEPNDKEEQEPPASIWFQGGLTDFLYLEEKNVGVDLASENNDPQIHEASSVPGHSNNQPETALTELLTEEEKTESQESTSNWFNLGLSNVLNFGHTEKDTIAMEDQQSRETEDETNKNEEVQTSDQKESHTDKESKETVKAVTEEDEENYAQDMIVSNSNVPNSGETPANMHTLDDTKSTSNSTESSFDIQTDDKEKSNEPYTSEEDLVSESQLLKNTEAEKRNQESEKNHGHSGWYTTFYNSFINYNMNTNDNQQGHESVVSDQIPSPPSSPQTCDPSDTKNIEEKPDIAEEQSHFSFSSFADMLMFWSSTANEEQVQSLQDEVLSSEETPQAENADEILQGKNNRAMKLQANQRNSEEGSEKDEDAVQESSLSSSLAVQNNERVNEKAKHIVKLVSDSDASQVLSAETQVQPEEYQNQYVPWFSYFSAVGHVSKSSESQENTNIKGYYNDAVYKDSLHLHSKLNLENTVDIGTRLQGKSKMETVKTVQKEQNNLNTYIHQSVNSENDLQSYGELPGTADDHLGMKKTPHDGEQGLTLETSEKGKPVKCCDTKQNSALKSQFKKDGDVKEKTHKLENKNNLLGFHENNIKDFSEVAANDEQDQNSEECQEVPPDQLLSPQHSSNRFSLRGTKTSEEAGDLEGMWSFRMEGAGSRRKLLEKTPEKEHEMNIAVDSECDDDHHSEATAIPSVNSEEKTDSSVADSPFDVEKPSLDAIQNYVPSSGGWTHQILLCLNALEIGELIKSVFSAVTSIIKTALASLPEVMRPGPDLYGFPWEVVICTGIVGAFTILLFLYRSYQSIRSRLYVGREKQLANKIAELVEEKCKLLEKLSLGQKEFKDLELSLKDGNIMKESTEASVYKEMLENLKKLKLELNQEIENLEKELKEEKSTQSEYGNLEAELQERLESLENEEKSTQSQTDEAKSTLKVYQINTERLKTSLQDAVDENSHLQESAKQLFQEAERWHERISELNEQIKIFSSSKADVEEVLKNKESQVKSLTQYLLKMKDWSSAITDDDEEDNHWDTDIKGETENGEHLDDQQKRTVKKLIYAAKLSARLKTLETERDQMYSKLSDENKAKGELAECIENLQSQQASLQSENDRLESEVQKLQQKLKVMTELYQENEMKLHRKLTVAERERLQKEEKLSKVDEKINHAAEELNSYRQRAKDLEEELERTIRSYQNQITSLEKKSHDNWLTARAAERHLDNIKKENAQNRQKLTEAEFKLDLLEKDPYALDVPVRPFGRGSRGPAAMNEAGNERGELNSDRLTDPHRPPSDTGSLSPPWDRERRIILPPPVLGEPYTDPALSPQRQEGFFPNPPSTGRLSGPAELRTYNMQSFDKTDGQTSSENSPLTEPSGNEMKDHSNPSNSLPDQSLACESETISSGFAPPPFPPVRPPLMPVDTRAPFVRRGPPFPPPPPPGMYGPRECFPVRDFGHLRPPLPIRNQFPMRPYPHYPPQ
ncbi:melanoma inhibitory activity protein 2 isoform X2 [Cuculus canorus]|uniref:melanoma inhibitory activity protein 2 isoform X2 n=1 Tax=Cuculus canorus TaxID=55661 RepID=UPI0023AB4605|nr:melanoma inhibitory activity protein 2 isoform X2 [Cuculus canorus]